MARWNGTEQLQLTSSPDGESSPRWSPDGKYLSFLASRGTEDEKKRGAQVWLLPRSGGEATKLTDVKGGVADYAWSPDSTRLAFVASDDDPDAEPEKKDGWKRKTVPPIVIDRYRFKEDREGTSRASTSTSPSSISRPAPPPRSRRAAWTMAARRGRRTARASPS